GAIDQSGRAPLGIIQQHLEEVLRCELLMSLTRRERLGRLNETASAVGILFEIHVPTLSLFFRPSGATRTSSMGEQLRASRTHVRAKRRCPVAMWEWQFLPERGLARNSGAESRREGDNHHRPLRPTWRPLP